MRAQAIAYILQNSPDIIGDQPEKEKVARRLQADEAMYEARRAYKAEKSKQP